MGESKLDASLADALLAPLAALAAAQRDLSEAALASFRAGLVTDEAGRGGPRRHVLVIGAPGSREPRSASRIDLPALALRPAPNLAITGADVELTWQSTAIVLPQGSAG